jgi:hypothetical protein
LNGGDRLVIEAAILAECSERWRKVARVVTRTEDVLKTRYPGLTFHFYTEYLSLLVEEGRLDSQGYVYYIRHSEVRLPAQSSSGGETKREGGFGEKGRQT